MSFTQGLMTFLRGYDLRKACKVSHGPMWKDANFYLELGSDEFCAALEDYVKQQISEVVEPLATVIAELEERLDKETA